MRIDRYEVIERLGAGGRGTVFRARHVELGHPVALKLLRPEHAHDATAVARFLREARVLSAIQSPHVVRVTDFGVSGAGQPFLVMELVEGPDLERVLERRRRIPADEAVGLALDVLAGLAAVHAAGAVHRDLKPANVIVGAEVVKVVDFGLARFAAPGGASDGALTRTGEILATPIAVAPEQAAGNSVDARADLWAVGALLYRALAGRRPFEGVSAEDLIVRVCSEPAPPLCEVAPDVPAPLAAVVDRALARDPEERWADAMGMSVALRAAMGAVDRAARAAIDPADQAPAAAEQDEEAEEETAAARSDPGPRPSLAFAEVRPRAAWKLPLALAGFVLGAGALIALALALRPTLDPASRAPTAPAAPLPAYDEVPGVVVSVAPDPGPARAAPRHPQGAGLQVRVIERQGPLAGVIIQNRVLDLATTLSDLRGPEVRRLEVAGTVQPDGRVVVDAADPVSRRIADARLELPAMNRPTRFRLEVVLEPRGAP